MTLRWMYDASRPPLHPPHWHVCAGYIGGNTPYVWTPEDWERQWSPFRLPIFTASNRADDVAMAHIDAGLIEHALQELGVPEGVTVCVDTETTVYTVYLETLNREVAPWHLLNYGSLSYVRRNPQCSAGRWAADWTDDIRTGIDLVGEDRIVAIQYEADDESGEDYDSSVIINSIPLWEA